MMTPALEGRDWPVGYRMISSFKASNFRGFANLEISDLSRINVIVGRNASGKTALLEALRASTHGGPQIIPWLSQFRGMPILPLLPPQLFKLLWDVWFRDLDSSRPIDLAHTNSDGRHFTLRIQLDFRSAFTTPQTQPGASVGVSPITVIPVIFEQHRPDGSTIVLTATLGPQGQLVYNMAAPEVGPATGFFPSTMIYNPQDNATWYSNLALQKQDYDIVETLRREFPYLDEIRVLSPTGISDVYATVGKHLSLPITNISSGIHKFLTLLLAATTYKRGVLLIDEVENGLFHDRLGALWTILYRICEKSDCQIFASSHSQECLEAMLPTMDIDANAFSLIHVERGDDSCVAEVTHGSEVRAAIEQGIEMRD